ncbi:hypothetical protein C8Q76DRAFT_792387 [Earliella scabrosa]|nr:hypothetical protein C8Q76DRAFT_792387 [Earliella scabrosa]
MDAWRENRLPEALNQLSRLTSRSPANTHTPSSLDDLLSTQRATLQVIVDEKMQQIAAPNEVQNSTFSTFRLPVELLWEVFDYLYLAGHEDAVARRTFVDAMLTCRWWRQVACGNTQFWTRVRINNLEYTKVCLERSRDQALTLVLEDTGCEYLAQIIDLIKPHIHRVKSIDVAHSNADVLLEMFSKLDVPAQHLESLRVRRIDYYTPAVILPPIFAGSVPSLCTLELQRVGFSSMLEYAGSLPVTTLRLRIGFPNSLSSMLDLLDACKQLKELTIFEHLYWFGADPPAAQRLVTLPVLEVFSVPAEPLAQTEALLSQLNLPQAVLRVSVNISCTGGFDVPDLREVAPGLPCVQNLRRLEIHWTDIYFYTFRAFRDLAQQDNPDIEITFYDRWDPQFYMPIEWPFDVSHVEELVFRMGDSLSSKCVHYKWDVFNAELSNVKRLRVINLDRDSALYLFMTLTECWRSDDGSERFLFQCNSLETLDLVGVDSSCPDVKTAFGKMLRARMDLADVFQSVTAAGTLLWERSARAE